MLYLALLIITLLLLGLTSWEWRRNRKANCEALDLLHQRIAEHLALAEWDAAHRLLNRLKQEGREETRTHLLRLQLLRQTQRHEEALVVVDQQLNTNCDALLFHLEKGKLLLDSGQVDEAVEAFERCQPIIRNDNDLILLASALFHANRVSDAWERLATHLPNTTNGPLLSLAADCRYALQDYEQALGYYQRAIEAGYDAHRTLARIGHCYRHLQRYDKVQECFSIIIDQDPTNITAVLNLGACLETLGNYQAALAAYQREETWAVGDPRLYYRAGVCAVHCERYPFAEIYLRRALELGVHSPSLLAYLAFSLERLQRWIHAEEIYFQLLREYPAHTASYRGLAWLYGVGLSSRIDREQGLMIARKGVKLAPDPISWEVLSACEARAGNFAAAHRIQEALTAGEQDQPTLLRRRRAMRALRKKTPLDERLVAHTLVA